jgi:hemerythrin
MAIQWDDSYMIGIAEIDEQHRGIVEHLTSLSEQLQSDFSQQQLFETAAFLKKYVVDHFAAEEALMLRYSYPKLAEQQEEHRLFNAEVESLVAEVEQSGGSRETALKLLGKMVRWVINHLRNHDREMGEYLVQAMQTEQQTS